jgi:hypothetical protein
MDYFSHTTKAAVMLERLALTNRSSRFPSGSSGSEADKGTSRHRCTNRCDNHDDQIEQRKEKEQRQIQKH